MIAFSAAQCAFTVTFPSGPSSRLTEAIAMLLLAFFFARTIMTPEYAVAQSKESTGEKEVPSSMMLGGMAV